MELLLAILNINVDPVRPSHKIRSIKLVNLIAFHFDFKNGSCAQLPNTPLQKRIQVRFWIPVQIPIDYDYMMPRLPENQKIKIPQVGSLTKKFQK